MDGPEFVLTLVAMGLFSGLVYSVLRTVGRYLEGRPSGGRRELSRLREDLEALRGEVAELQEGRDQRLLELEERIDFAERLLAQERARASLPKQE